MLEEKCDKQFGNDPWWEGLCIEGFDDYNFVRYDTDKVIGIFAKVDKNRENDERFMIKSKKETRIKLVIKLNREHLKKGVGVHLDVLHKNRLEVVDKNGKVKLG